jgi:hypothetical protein
MQSNRVESTLPGTRQTTPVNTTVSVLSRLSDQACDTHRHQNCPPPKPSSARARKLGHKPDKLEARSLRAGGATALHCATVDPNSIQLFGRWKSHDSIPPYSGKTACSTIRKTNVLQRSIFLLQGGVFVALQPNNYQTFAIVIYPATPFPSMDLWVTRTKIERLTAGIVEW